MPLDGIVINNIIYELNCKILNAKIDKVHQPEKDELIIHIRSKGNAYKLLLSASSSYARIHFTTLTKKNPLTPPAFCMLLRKHLTGGRIVEISQPDFERIVKFSIESYNELGDLELKHLYIEIMGRHSNIILTDSNNKIIDSIKRVDTKVSRVRQILPGLNYVFPPSQNKLNPLTVSEDKIKNILSTGNEGNKTDKFLVNHFTGISPLVAREISYLTLSQTEAYIGELNEDDIYKITNAFLDTFKKIKKAEYNPVMIYDDKNKIIDFSAINITQYPNYKIEHEDSINVVLEKFYYTRDKQDRLKQKSSELLKIITNNLERCKKKLAIQQNKLKEVEDRDKLKMYGNLIIANIHKISKGMDYIEVENYYEENSPKIKIPIDPTLSPAHNAQKYFTKYNKAKNTLSAVSSQLENTKNEITYLESLYDSILRTENENELIEIKNELIEQGYLKKKRQKNENNQTHQSEPMHFISSQNFDIYVGKNNKQNDYLTLKFAKKNDIWLHTKAIPGSHTIIKAKNNHEIPIETIKEAAMLAAYYSKGRASSNVPVDYTQVKNVKKPPGAKPGMVIYDNYKTIYVTPKQQGHTS